MRRWEAGKKPDFQLGVVAKRALQSSLDRMVFSIDDYVFLVVDSVKVVLDFCADA